MEQMQYDDTQRAVIECEDQFVVGEAKAGAGKTTTAVGATRYRSNDRFLYICLNKSVQMEAQRRFPPNVECRTTHSLAFGAVGRKYGSRVTPKWGVRLLADDMNVANPRIAAVARAALVEFFGSVEPIPGEVHVEEVAHQWLASDIEKLHALDVARRAWREMQDLQSKVNMPHDGYLKMWALSKPTLRHQRIILDEAQDTNPVTKQVVLGQRNAKLMLLGDRHQSIYLFRGSKNAMEEFAASGATVLQMPRTWRFGDRTALIANELLARLKGEQTKIVGLGKDARMPSGAPFAFLSRTNSVLFGVAVQRRGKGVHWVGGISNYRIDLVLDAYHLYSGRRGDIRDALLRRYDSWARYVEDAESTKDAEARILIKIVEEFRHEIPQLVEELRDNEELQPEKADIILTTAHRAKGLEFDYVRVGDDFECLEDAETELKIAGVLTPQTAQEINLLYVAITRARKFVMLNTETKQWLERYGVDLPNV